MPKKSKRSAIVMGCLFVIPAVTVAFIAGEIRYYWIPPAERNPVVTGGFAGTGPALIAAAILAVSIVLASLIICRLDESHFGRGGAIRWTAAGALYGLLQQLVLTPIPLNFDYTAVSILKQIGGDVAWKVAALVLAYAIVFPIGSFIGKRFWRSSRDIPFSH
ncbi:MAG: hypothetical protein WBM17_01125 [Anaerolineales bacterium]